MPSPYSLDLRIKVINYLELGYTIKETANMFSMSPATVFKWKKLKNNTGCLKPKSSYQKGHSHKITNLEEFKKFVEDNFDLTQEELATKWEGVSSSTIERNLRKIGFTRKKKPNLTRIRSSV